MGAASEGLGLLGGGADGFGAFGNDGSGGHAQSCFRCGRLDGWFEDSSFDQGVSWAARVAARQVHVDLGIAYGDQIHLAAVRL